MSAPGTLIEDLMLLVDKHVTSRRARTTRMVLLQGRNLKPETNGEQKRAQPEIIPDNFRLICARCKENLGSHLGYRCPDRKGEFREVRA